MDVQGSAHSNATVTVNLQSTYRKAEYFRAELSADNSSGPLWFGVTNVAVLTNGGGPDIVTTNEGNLLVAKATEAFLHDFDGNLTSDSLWTNTWNGENRLIATESRTDVPSAGRAKETWSHLPDGRWIERIVANWNGSAYTNAYTNRFVWDGQVLLAILDHTNGLVSSFVRGLDLSGSIQGAGGVGGVVTVNIATNGVHFCAFDANGNVSALVSATSGAVTANYEYSPFGETLRANGVVAKANFIRFSTQLADDVTGSKKYLHRDLTDAGRWPNRDSIGEIGFKALTGIQRWGYREELSLYRFNENNPINTYDWLGLAPNPCGTDECKCLGCIVFSEARGQADACQKAVADVVKNRAVDKNKNVCDIVAERDGKEFNGYTTPNYKNCCEDKCVNKPKGPQDKTERDKAFKNSECGVASGSNAGNANYFHDTSMGTPDWIKRKIDAGKGSEIKVPGCSAFRFYHVDP